MTSLGGRAVQYSHWNGFDRTAKAETNKLTEDLLEKKPRVVWTTLPCTTQRTQQSQLRSRFHRVQMNILVVFLWILKQDWCEAIVSELKEQFHSGRTLGCQWSSFTDAHIDVGQICYVPDDVFMVTLIKHWRKKRCSTHRNWSRQLRKGA